MATSCRRTEKRCNVFVCFLVDFKLTGVVMFVLVDSGDKVRHGLQILASPLCANFYVKLRIAVVKSAARK